MSNLTRAMMMGAAGTASDSTYVDDVFSTFVYKGDGQNPRNINNGIDLAGEGGLVWVKARNLYENNILVDTERGATNRLWSDSANSQAINGGTVKGFNNNGFQVDNNGYVNGGSGTYASWTFRKAPGFFDVVTYTGNDGGASQVINHNLGSTPGMVIIKPLGFGGWYVYHRSIGFGSSLLLNSTSDNSFGSSVEASSSTTITVTASVNTNGGSFVAYIFAHDDASFGTGGDESIIKCGSYTGSSSNSYSQEINVGFEPQWLMVKASGSTGSWNVVDTMRGFEGQGVSSPPDSRSLLFNSTSNEDDIISLGNGAKIKVTSTGFKFESETNIQFNENGGTYVYMAIRRPNKPPEAATEVFAIDTGNSSSSGPTWDSGFPVDLAFAATYANTGDKKWGARLTGQKYLKSNASDALAAESNFMWDHNDGWGIYEGVSQISYMFKRAPGFMDVVNYTGTSSSNSIPHNLGVVPELQIVKAPNHGGRDWVVFTSKIDGSNDYLTLNSTDQATNSTQSIPTATTFTFSGSGTPPNSNINGSVPYVSYLFATLPGISKVGTYSGTGNAINVDCGFTNGARFLLIKSAVGSESAGGKWYVWDTLRGISSGNDPYFTLNQNAAQVTNQNYVGPLAAGFTVTSSAPAALNASGNTYLFLAIA